MSMKGGSMADVPHTERDLPMKAIMIGIVLFVCRCSRSTTRSSAASGSRSRWR
jgi:hypothetical protein